MSDVRERPVRQRPPAIIVTEDGVARIAALDIDRMTPLEALQLLAELKKLA